MAARSNKALSLYKEILRRIERLEYTDKAYMKSQVKQEFQNGRLYRNVNDIEFQLKVHKVDSELRQYFIPF